MEDPEKELSRFAAAMRELVDTKAWRTYCEIIEQQIRTRETIILDNPAGNAPSGETPMDMLLRLEQIKGARLGLRLALDSPSRIIEDAKAAAPSEENDE